MMAPAAGNCTLAAPSVADSCHSSCRSYHTAVQHTVCFVAILCTEQNDGCCCVGERFGCTHHHRVLGNTGTKCSLDEDCCNLHPHDGAAESPGFAGSLAVIITKCFYLNILKLLFNF